jgi:DNA-binding response OmpR family regulator
LTAGRKRFIWRLFPPLRGVDKQLQRLKEIMRKSRILIVDDEAGLVRVLALNLERMDRYEVLTVVDATEALEAAVKFKPDLIILDWIMPTITGGDVAQQVRADSRVCDTPILFFSAFIMKRDGTAEIGGFPAIAKPVGMSELVEAIDEQLGKAVNRSKMSVEIL